MGCKDSRIPLNALERRKKKIFFVHIERNSKKEFVLPGDFALTEIYVIAGNHNRIKGSAFTIKTFQCRPSNQISSPSGRAGQF